MERLHVEANGLPFTCLTHGEGDKLALLLHGFPDDPGSWRPLMERLAAAGFRAVAPWMRGYGPTGPAPDGRYRPTELGADACALVTALGYGDALLIGHDWGAVASYTAANLQPERWWGMVAMSVPPNPVFMANLLKHPAQLWRSWYMGYINLPGSAARIRADDLAFLDRLWGDWCPGWAWPPERLAEVKDSLRPEGHLEAALTYYHELGRRLPLSPRESWAAWKIGARKISVPGLLLSGAQDGCIATEMFEGAEAAFDAPCRVEVIEGAGHFLPLEAPDAVWRSIDGWLRGMGG